MLRMLAFGDLDIGVWGAVWDLGEGRPRFALLGGAVPGGATAVEVGVEGSDPEPAWRLSGPGIELEASPEGEAGALDGGFEQLIRVSGRWALGGSEHAVACLGRRGTRTAIDAGRFGAVRDVSAWFEPDLGMAALAARPRGASGHADEALSACVLEEGHPLQIAEPRLSTTYAASGIPVRASLELWPQPPGDEGDRVDEDESVARFPRRAAGEAVGAGGNTAAGLLNAHAELFRWHARGREGAGVYVLVNLPAT